MSEAKEKTTKSSGLKKFLMHQTAGTKAGRKLISSFVGENGNEIIEAVKTITAKVEDKETAKKNKERIFRFALKVKLMFDDGLLKRKDVLHIIDPVDHLVGKFVKLLMAKKVTKDDSVAVSNSVDRLRFEIVDVVGKHMQEKNKEKLNALFNYYGATKFVDFLLMDEKVKNEKAIILKNLTPIVKEYTPHLCKGLGIPLDTENKEVAAKGAEERKS